MFQNTLTNIPLWNMKLKRYDIIQKAKNLKYYKDTKYL